MSPRFTDLCSVLSSKPSCRTAVPFGIRLQSFSRRTCRRILRNYTTFFFRITRALVCNALSLLGACRCVLRICVPYFLRSLRAERRRRSLSDKCTKPSPSPRGEGGPAKPGRMRCFRTLDRICRICVFSLGSPVAPLCKGSIVRAGSARPPAVTKWSCRRKRLKGCSPLTPPSPALRFRLLRRRSASRFCRPKRDPQSIRGPRR